MLTDYIRSDGHSTDTAAVTSLTWECGAVVMIHCRLADSLKWLFASSGEKDNDDTLRRSRRSPPGRSDHSTPVLCAGDSEGVLGSPDGSALGREKESSWQGYIHRRHATPPES